MPYTLIGESFFLVLFRGIGALCKLQRVKITACILGKKNYDSHSLIVPFVDNNIRLIDSIVWDSALSPFIPATM